MLIHQPLELKDNNGKGRGLWHMTERSDEEHWPAHAIGYCAENCPGHATAEEAEDHYHQWQADKAIPHEDPEAKKPCLFCGEWTQHRMTPAGGWSAPLVLCEQHSHSAHIIHILRNPGREPWKENKSAEPPRLPESAK